MPEELVSKGRSENSIAGFVVGHDTLQKFINKFGKYDERNYDNWTDIYIWKRKDYSISISFQGGNAAKGKPVDQISIDGAKVPAAVGQTSFGAEIGDHFAKIEEVYGDKHVERKWKSENLFPVANRYFTWEWTDGNTLSVWLNKNDVVVGFSIGRNRE